MSLLEASHNAYDVFIFTLEALSLPAEGQCERMGDFNTAWELRDDALAGYYLIGSGLMSEEQEDALRGFLALVDPVPVKDMPSGSGRDVNLKAMQHPAWEAVRKSADDLLATLAPVTAANIAYFQSNTDVP